MKRTVLLLLAILGGVAVTACNKTLDDLPNNPNHPQPIERMIIRTGTSFGECGGYCRTELVVDSTIVTHKKHSWQKDDPNYPDVLQTMTIAYDELVCLVNAVDIDTFKALDTTIGCPDCADGGAEWVEIETADFRRRITFEHGASVGAIQPLIDKLRQLRSGFADGLSYEAPVGTWDWVQSIGGFAGSALTPATEGYTQRYIYRPDGTVTIYRNGQLYKESTYTVVYQDNPNGGERTRIINYGTPDIGPHRYTYSSDTLHLNEPCVDCYNHLFLRSVSICD